MTTSTTYNYLSQQPALMATMVGYALDPANWIDGIPRMTDLTPGSVIYTIFAAVSIAADALGYAVFMDRNAAYISTATGVDLDNKVADFGLTRNPAVPATGNFNFNANNAPAYNVSIPAGTRITTIATATQPAIIYATQQAATLLSGQTSVTVAVTAQLPGSASNIAAGTQLLLGSMVPGIDTVTLVSNISSGADTETDSALRARALLAFPALAHGTTASYQAIAESIPGVASAVVVPQNRGPGTVDIFIEGPDNSVPSSDLIAEVQTAMNAQVIATDNVLVQAPIQVTINATLSVHLTTGVNVAATLTAVQTAVTNYISGLGVGAGSIGYVYASQLVATALGVSGVVNATSTFTDTAILSQQLPVAGTITVDSF